ncbi:WD40 domain-containing protein, partial [Cephalotus follicularis]
PTRLQSLRLPLSMKADKILRLKYSSSGSDILALSSSAIILVWKWQQHDEPKAKAKATTKMVPRLKQVKSGIIMTNDLPKSKPEESLPCMVVSNNDSYAVSASGGRVSLFNLVTFETLTTFMPPQPTVTCLALHPLDNNMVAAGMDDSTLHIFEASLNEVTNKLKGHSGRITGLAFSHWLKSLISSGADAQIIVWNFFSWKIQRNTFLKTSDGKAPAEPLDTHVEFHKDERHFLAVNRTQLAIYDGQNLQCRKQWFVRDYWAPISHAAFSGDSQSVYAAFLDGNVFIFHAPSLRVQYRIGPAAYMPSCISSKPYPLVIAPNPQEPNQFSIGLSEGGVVVLEPLESEGQWGVRVPAVDNPLSIATISGSGSDSDSGSCSDQG